MSKKKNEIDEKFVGRLTEIVNKAGGQNAFARECGVSQSLIGQYLSGAEPNRRILVTMAKAAKRSVSWLADGEHGIEQSNILSDNTANISTGSNINGDISQSIGIEQHHPAASQPTSSAPTIALSPMEHEIILLMREHMSMAEQRALLLELRSEAAKFS